MLLITGATGYLGQKLLKQLSTQESVLILARSAKKLRSSFANVRVIEADLLDPSTLKGKFDQVSQVIHLASLTHSHNQQQYFRVNVIGTENLLNSLPKKIKRFVYASTTSSAPNAGGYGESKYQAEKLITEKLDNYTILRIGDVFGGNGEKAIDLLINRCKKWPIFPMIGTGEFPMAPVHIDNVIQVLMQSLQLSGKNNFVVTGSEIFSFRELVERIYRLLGRHPILLPIPQKIFHMLYVILSLAKVNGIYPDQVERLSVVKNLKSDQTWDEFGINPKSFHKWLWIRVSSFTS